MITGLYSAASAMDGALLRHEVVAGNLAHATVPGFRRAEVRFEPLRAGTASLDVTGVRPSNIGTSFAPGSLQQTGRRFDVAIVGDAFFVVDGPGGTVLTRSGAFRLDDQNRLVTQSGYSVQGQGGPISIPQQVAQLVIARDGRILADGNEIDRLRLVRVQDRENLERVGSVYFRNNGAESEVAPGEVRIEQGYLEASNVEPVREIIQMLTGLRQYEAARRTLQSISESLGMRTRPDR